MSGNKGGTKNPKKISGHTQTSHFGHFSIVPCRAFAEKFELGKTRYFVAILRFATIHALFGDLWAKKVPFWVKNSVSWARSALLRYMLHIILS